MVTLGRGGVAVDLDVSDLILHATEEVVHVLVDVDRAVGDVLAVGGVRSHLLLDLVEDILIHVLHGAQIVIDDALDLVLVTLAATCGQTHRGDAGERASENDDEQLAELVLLHLVPPRKIKQNDASSKNVSRL